MTPLDKALEALRRIAAIADAPSDIKPGAYSVSEFSRLSVGKLGQALMLEMPNIRTALADIDAGGWQPIATAPRGDNPEEDDGPPILLGQIGWETGHEGFWYANWQNWLLTNLGGDYGSEVHRPTHWQPLPPAPKGETE